MFFDLNILGMSLSYFFCSSGDFYICPSFWNTLYDIVFYEFELLLYLRTILLHVKYLKICFHRLLFLSIFCINEFLNFPAVFLVSSREVCDGSLLWQIISKAVDNTSFSPAGTPEHCRDERQCCHKVGTSPHQSGLGCRKYQPGLISWKIYF